MKQRHTAICGDGKRERTRAFTELCSHYLFRDRFGRPGKGNDKGKVEGLVKHARMNFMVPIPEASSFEELNARLEQRCRDRQGERAGRHPETIGERLVADLAALRDLPAVPLEPCEKRAARVSSTALVRYRTNDYSVPTTYGFRDVVVKGFVDEVVILYGGQEIARHRRCHGEGAFIADPLHYLALIETKPGALDQAAACRVGSYPTWCSIFATCWKPGWGTAASASLSRCCGCWRRCRSTLSPPPPPRRSTSVRSASTRSS